MKKSFFLPVLFMLIISACTSVAQHADLKPDAFQKGLKTADAQVLDVRTSQEYNNGHIEDAIRADWTNRAEFDEKIKSLDKTKPVYIYCQSGRRSSAAAEQLKDLGFTEVYNLAGGMRAWNSSKKPVAE